MYDEIELGIKVRTFSRHLVLLLISLSKLLLKNIYNKKKIVLSLKTSNTAMSKK